MRQGRCFSEDEAVSGEEACSTASERKEELVRGKAVEGWSRRWMTRGASTKMLRKLDTNSGRIWRADPGQFESSGHRREVHYTILSLSLEF